VTREVAREAAGTPHTVQMIHLDALRDAAFLDGILHSLGGGACFACGDPNPDPPPFVGGCISLTLCQRCRASEGVDAPE